MENSGAGGEVNKEAADYHVTQSRPRLESEAESVGRMSTNTAANPEPSTLPTDLTLQIPPRPGNFSKSRSGKGFLQSISFKKMKAVSEGERSSLLSSDSKATPPGSPSFSDISPWPKCASVPVTPASYLSPRTLSERQRTHEAAARVAVSRSLSVPGRRSYFIVRSLSLNFIVSYFKALRSDRGGEFTSREFLEFCEVNGIRRPLTVPRSPQQNGVAERKNRTIMEMARSMLKTKNLPKEFWAEAVACAVYLSNRTIMEQEHAKD